MQKLLVSIFLVLSATLASAQGSGVVYHITTGLDTIAAAMSNIQNHLSADPNVKIVVVAHGLGIDFLLKDAMNQMEQPFGPAIADLASKGVEFRVCNNTLVTRKIDKSKVIQEASIVPSGVAEAAKLQAREGYVYLRP